MTEAQLVAQTRSAEIQQALQLLDIESVHHIEAVGVIGIGKTAFLNAVGGRATEVGHRVVRLDLIGNGNLEDTLKVALEQIGGTIAVDANIKELGSWFARDLAALTQAEMLKPVVIVDGLDVVDKKDLDGVSQLETYLLAPAAKLGVLVSARSGSEHSWMSPYMRVDIRQIGLRPLTRDEIKSQLDVLGIHDREYFDRLCILGMGIPALTEPMTREAVFDESRIIQAGIERLMKDVKQDDKDTVLEIVRPLSVLMPGFRNDEIELMLKEARLGRSANVRIAIELMERNRLLWWMEGAFVMDEGIRTLLWRQMQTDNPQGLQNLCKSAMNVYSRLAETTKIPAYFRGQQRRMLVWMEENGIRAGENAE